MSYPENESVDVAPSSKETPPVPNAVEGLIQQGLQLHLQERFAEAQVLYDQALAIEPDRFDVLYLLGALSGQTKQYTKAVDFLTRALALNPEHAGCHFNLGRAFHDLKRYEESVASYDNAIRLNPTYPDAYSNRGLALHDLKRLDEALASFDEAIKLKPDYAEAYYNRGNTLLAYMRFEEGLGSYSQALVYKPDFGSAHHNRGSTLLSLRQHEEAMADFHHAISLKPDFADAHWNLSLCNLLAGDFKNGWPGYEWRWQLSEFSSPKRNFTQPLWLGQESLENQTILLHAEQGLGDAIQFCRYAPMVAQRGGRVILEVQGSLVKLLSQLQGVSEVIASGAALPPFDYHCPLLSLPLAFNTDVETIPGPPANFRSDALSAVKWLDKLSHRSNLRVGLVWSGSTIHRGDYQRSLTLAQLISYLPPGPEYISLQKELRAVDQETLARHPEIKHFGAELSDFSDTAALCEAMDLIITVDTSVAHLAGTLGKPTWLLLPYSPDWRWLLDRNDSPWYPSMRLFRQTKIGHWVRVLQDVEAELRRCLKASVAM